MMLNCLFTLLFYASCLDITWFDKWVSVLAAWYITEHIYYPYMLFLIGQSEEPTKLWNIIGQNVLTRVW